MRLLPRVIMLMLPALVPALSSYAQSGNGDAPPAGTRVEAIDDSMLGMTAYSVTVPAKWHFAGAIIEGTSCSSIPFPVFRATSPDGLTAMEMLPRMDWTWQEGPGAESARDANHDCLPLEEYLHVQDFLKVVARMMDVEYAGESPIPAAELERMQQTFERNKAANQARYWANGMQPPDERREDGQAFVRYTNGSFTMKGLLSASTYCSAVTRRRPPGFSGPPYTAYQCTATVRYVRAPEAQLDAALQMLKLEHAGEKQEGAWLQAWNARLQQQTQQNIRIINQMGQDSMRNIQAMSQASMAQQAASHQQFMQSQATNQRLHEQFLGTMQRGTDLSMARASQAMQARSTSTSNIVDYALNQQTVRDPNTGQITKVSNANTYTWLDNTGKVGYQTSDGLANPNGVLPGTWTRQEVVNGDGTPQ
ncbi:MAG TPA: hypothetical protein VME68_06280 [Acidobacteriaceae bacterium]|nr:hypothetical protein [Acidobacteriaceae bacterium]